MKEEFKHFVREHPTFAYFVANGTMTWQKFYEMYDMYGENSIIWDPYLKDEKNTDRSYSNNRTSSTPKKRESTLRDIIDLVKGVDIATVQKGIDGVQKAIGLVQDLTGKQTPSTSNYEPRPMYKYFED